MARGGIDPRLDPNTDNRKASDTHMEYVKLAQQFFTHYEQQWIERWQKMQDWWDLFLAIQKDERDPIDEQWRSNVFVPLPFSTTRTKAAQLVEHIANAEPIWQPVARHEGSQFFEQGQQLERLVQYAHDMNKFRKFFIKIATARSVQGTAFFKVVWTRRSHMVTLYPQPEDYQRFIAALQNATMAGAPPAPDYLTQPEEFEHWRELVHKAKRFGFIPAPPVRGRVPSVEYEGPLFQYLPPWHVYLDAFVDEMEDQRFIVHRMIKPLSYVLERADADPNSPKPYYLPAVEAAMQGVTGEAITEYDRQLATKMRLNPTQEQHPYLQGNRSVELWEIWSPQEPFKYSILMNQKRVINKSPFESPLLTTTPNLFAVRNIVVPGIFPGLSDYQEPETLFIELNRFRRLRQDGATLSTLPVFIKQAGLALGDALRRIRPGMVMSVPGNVGAVTSLIQHQLPPEAYREPPEMKAEIEDATEVPPYLKGAQANIGRVTGTEFSGRAQRSDLKYKVDASFVEDEMSMVPATILSFFAQVKGSIRKEIGGDPDALVDLSRDQLIAGLGRRFRMRGVTEAIDRDMEVQQLLMAFKEFGDVLTPAERRFGLQLVMQRLDVRGWSDVVTPEGTQMISGQAGAAAGAQNAANQASQGASEAAGVQAPAQLSPQDAAAMGGGGGSAQ